MNLPIDMEKLNMKDCMKTVLVSNMKLLIHKFKNNNKKVYEIS